MEEKASLHICFYVFLAKIVVLPAKIKEFCAVFALLTIRVERFSIKLSTFVKEPRTKI